MPAPALQPASDIQHHLVRVLAVTTHAWSITAPAPRRRSLYDAADRARQAAVRPRRRIEYDLQFAW
jgi:hypothetical protein